MRLIFVVVGIFLVADSLKAQDTLLIDKPFKYDLNQRPSRGGKNVFSFDNYEFGLVNTSNPLNVVYAFKEFQPLIFENGFLDSSLISLSASNCSFLTNYTGTRTTPYTAKRGASLYDFKNISTKSLTFKAQSCEFYFSLYIKTIDTALLRFDNCFIQGLNIENIKDGSTELSRDSLVYPVQLTNSTQNVFRVNNSGFSDSVGSVKIYNSNVSYYAFLNNFCNSIFLGFYNDSLFGAVNIAENTLLSNNQYKSKAFTSSEYKKLTIQFENCFINCPISIHKNDSFVTKIIFSNVSFGPGARLNSLSVDTVQFINCYNFSRKLLLSTDPSRITYVAFNKVDVSSVDFNYLGRLRFYLAGDIEDITDEPLISAYENCLAKFKTEGKIESYKTLDIDYKKYNYYKQGIWGSILNLIDKGWWYYGYRKHYIILWTLGFLLLFFIINWLHWGEIKNVYPIISEDVPEFDPKAQDRVSRLRTIINVLVFTSFIFFSLHIDFDKLQYKSSKWIAWFFIQYLVGLFCLFFIANAILKLG